MRWSRIVVLSLILFVVAGDADDNTTDDHEHGSGSVDEADTVDNSGLLIAGIASGVIFVLAIVGACMSRRKTARPLSQQNLPVSPQSEASKSQFALKVMLSSYGMPMIPLKVLTRES